MARLSDEAFAQLFPTRGRSQDSAGRLALITIFQFAEALPDRAAADAVRRRIDWKYAPLIGTERSRLRRFRLDRISRAELSGASLS